MRTVDRLRAVRERALRMSATDPPPPPRARPEPLSADNAPEHTPATRNPWLWATSGVAALAIAFGIWGLHERSNANDAKSDRVDEGLQQAADQITALVPRCKDSVASAGG